MMGAHLPRNRVKLETKDSGVSSGIMRAFARATILIAACIAALAAALLVYRFGPY